MKSLKRLMQVTGATAMLAAAVVTASAVSDIDATESHDFVSAHQFVESLGPGWNLGNTFDAHGGFNRSTGTFNGGFSWIEGTYYRYQSVLDMETAWLGGPQYVTTEAFLQAVYDAGFRTIRIPVTWYKATDFYAENPTFEIRADWMARVTEVVQWAYDLNMHIILNTHHENGLIGGYRLTNDRIESDLNAFEAIWVQIAEQFEDFSDRLIFAGLNEPRGSQNEWTGGTAETRYNINRLNQAFVDTVRATGGNNEDRFLVVTTHAASASANAFNGFVLPNDPAYDRLLLAVHTYSPFHWAHDGFGQYNEEGRQTVINDLTRVSEFAAQLNVPVILSEWGSINNGQPESAQQRAQHAYDYVSIARSLGMATVWWDNGGFSSGTNSHGFGLIRRDTGYVVFPEIIDAIVDASNTPWGDFVPEPEQEPEFSARLRLMNNNWAVLNGDWLTISDGGTHTVTVDGQKANYIRYLHIVFQGDPDERFTNATFTIDYIHINNNEIGHVFNPNTRLLPSNWQPGHGEFYNNLWNQWHAPGSILTSGITLNEDHSFRLASGDPIETISVTFTINNVVEDESDVYVIYSAASAYVNKIPGSYNYITITITQTLSNGTTNDIFEIFPIRNNDNNSFIVGNYEVFVSTQGNTEIRDIRIIQPQ